jgi:hypothetical protein
MTPTAKGLEAPPRPTSGKVVDALWSSAIDALVKTILILVMGNIALGILGGIFSSMTPSMPPFLAGSSVSQSHSTSSSMLQKWWSSAHEHQFAIIYAIMFAVYARVRLIAVFCNVSEASVNRTRLQKISNQLSKDWFRLIIGNAFGALVSAIVLYFVETFTGTRFLFNLLLAAILPSINAVATFLLGSGIVNFVGGLFSWYGDNQLRFNFWVLYVAAVCDDLGIPNLKTLARFAWSRWFRASGQQQPGQNGPQTATD